MLKIVFDGLIYSLQVGGGISRYSTEILNKMVQMDEELDVKLLIHDQVDRVGIWNKEIEIAKIPTPSSSRQPFKALQTLLSSQMLKRYLKKEKSGVFHTSYFTDYKERRLPKIVTVYDMIYEKFPKNFGNNKNTQMFIEKKRKGIKSADFVICISETTKRDLLEYIKIDEKKIFVTPLAASDIFSKTTSINYNKSQNPYFLYVGSRAWYKNTNFMLKAFSSWKESKNYFLYIVGNPLNENEKIYIKKLKLDKRIKVFNWPTDKELNDLYRNSVAYITPSLYEGFGITLLEAMHAGTLLLTASIPSTKEIVGSGALYFDPHDIESLHNAFDLSVEKKNRNSQIELNKLHAKKYAWEKTAQKTIEVYKKAIS